MRTSAVIFITGVKRALGSTSGLIYYTREGYFNITMIDLMDICFSRNRNPIFQAHLIQSTVKIELFRGQLYGDQQNICVCLGKEIVTRTIPEVMSPSTQ